jgi:hypothetical protein
MDSFTFNSWKPSQLHFEWQSNVPFVHNNDTKVDYYLAIEDDRLYCIFQSSHDKQDWIDDITFFPKKFNIYPNAYIFVHEGVAKQYLSMRNEFLDLAYNKKIKEILISGYSLGGGLAQLACEDAMWHFKNEKKIMSISYEGLRVFYPNKQVKELLKNNQILIKTFWDPVVHLPFKLMGFKDYGKIEWIGKLYRILPNQHLSPQISKNLLEKYKS